MKVYTDDFGCRNCGEKFELNETIELRGASAALLITTADAETLEAARDNALCQTCAMFRSKGKVALYAKLEELGVKIDPRPRPKRTGRKKAGTTVVRPQARKRTQTPVIKPTTSRHKPRPTVVVRPKADVGSAKPRAVVRGKRAASSSQAGGRIMRPPRPRRRTSASMSMFDKMREQLDAIEDPSSEKAQDLIDMAARANVHHPLADARREELKREDAQHRADTVEKVSVNLELGRTLVDEIRRHGGVKDVSESVDFLHRLITDSAQIDPEERSSSDLLREIGTSEEELSYLEASFYARYLYVPVSFDGQDLPARTGRMAYRSHELTFRHRAVTEERTVRVSGSAHARAGAVNTDGHFSVRVTRAPEARPVAVHVAGSEDQLYPPPNPPVEVVPQGVTHTPRKIHYPEGERFGKRPFLVDDAGKRWPITGPEQTNFDIDLLAITFEVVPVSMGSAKSFECTVVIPFTGSGHRARIREATVVSAGDVWNVTDRQDGAYVLRFGKTAEVDPESSHDDSPTYVSAPAIGIN